MTPTKDYFGPVALSYSVIDGNGGTVAAAQSFTLIGVNDAPTGAATAKLADGQEDAPYTVRAADLLAGFTDPDGDTPQVSGLAADKGTVTQNADGSYTVTPTKDYFGPVALSYSVVDGKGGTVAAAQSFTLIGVNDVVNGSFNGNLNGWASIGAVELDNGWAKLATGAESQQNLATFLNRSEEAVPGDHKGSAIKQEIVLGAGSYSLNFDWKFSSDEIKAGQFRDDVTFFISNATTQEIASVQPGNVDSASGHVSHNFSLATSGTVLIGFGAADAMDSANRSYLWVDNVVIA